MCNVYDTPGIQAILEEQRAKYPYGAIRTLKSPLVVVEGLAAEMALVIQAKEGKMSTTELAMRPDDLWLKARSHLQP